MFHDETKKFSAKINEIYIIWQNEKKIRFVKVDSFMVRIVCQYEHHFGLVDLNKMLFNKQGYADFVECFFFYY